MMGRWRFIVASWPSERSDGRARGVSKTHGWTLDESKVIESNDPVVGWVTHLWAEFLKEREPTTSCSL